MSPLAEAPVRAAGTARFDEALAEATRISKLSYAEVALAWKQKHPGAKVVGIYPVYSPIELVTAAGALPIGIFGGGNTIEIAHADSRFQSFVCSIIKSTLELAMTDKLAGFDAMFFHSICDPARNLSSVYARNFPALRVEYLHLPQNLAVSCVEDYLVSEYRRVLDSVAQLTGTMPTAEAIAQAIREHDRARALMRDLDRFRRENPEKLLTRELFLLRQAGTRLPPADHARLLEGALAGLPARVARPRDAVRVVLEGSFCEQPPLDLIQAIEEAGCAIVDDDFFTGWRFFREDVGVSPDPITALARAYRNRSVYSGIKHDTRESKTKHLIETARANRADAVLFLAAKFCEPALFDYALYRRALQEAQIPHLFLEFEEKAWVFDKLRSDIETFVESMLFD